MNPTNFTVIEGNLIIDPLEAGGSFVSAEVTNTRLMGVIGLHILRDRGGDAFHQFFYIDTEEYGLDDYQSFLNLETEAVERKKTELFGALGGNWNPITEKEALHLVKRAAKINTKYKFPLPEGISEYRPIIESDIALTLDELAVLWSKMTSEIRSDYELINYFLMRMVACDAEGMSRLSRPKANVIPLTIMHPGTLLRNEISKKDGSEKADGLNSSDGADGSDSAKDDANADSSKPQVYTCVSLIDLDKVYKLVESEIEVAERKIVKFRHKPTMDISPWEASLILKQSEYLVHAKLDGADRNSTGNIPYNASHGASYGASPDSKEVDEFRKLMTSLFSTMTESEYDFGSLFMIFRKNNDHVKKKVYRLDQDTLGVVCLLYSGELIFAGSELLHIEAVENSIMAAAILEGIRIKVTGRYKFPEPVLVRFIDSDFERFSDFLEYIQNFSDS